MRRAYGDGFARTRRWNARTRRCLLRCRFTVGISQACSRSALALDPSRFPTVKHFTSWLGLCPGSRVAGVDTPLFPGHNAVSSVLGILDRLHKILISLVWRVLCSSLQSLGQPVKDLIC